MSTSPPPSGMLFGLNRAEDERSLALFLQQFGRSELSEVLIPRLSDGEIDTLVDSLFSLLRTHLSKQEYHRLFLGEAHHHPDDTP